ncbi:hypothetical protein CCP3SC5AM1_1940004 [Gammaproteobacteria bacterium]
MPPPLEELRAATEQQSANGRFGFFIPAVGVTQLNFNRLISMERHQIGI